MDDGVVTADFKTTPYWWDAAPPRALDPPALPREIDVAIIGSGYTGLSAALTLARAGRGVHVFDAQHPGYGSNIRST